MSRTAACVFSTAAPSWGLRCAAWLYRPRGVDAATPCVVMAHGWTGVREQTLDAYAERFAAAVRDAGALLDRGTTAEEVLDTFAYYFGIGNGNFGYGAAAGLFKGVISLILILLANRLAHALGEDGLYRK